MNFSSETALAYARAIARPRLVGCSEEERVAQQLVAQLESFGYHVEREPFHFTRAFDIILAYEIGLALVLILLASVFHQVAFIFGILLVCLLAIVHPLNRAIHHHAVASDIDSLIPASPLTAFCLRLGRLYRTSNIVATPSPVGTLAEAGRVGRGSRLPHLYLISHLDSKSQRMPIIVRIILFSAILPGAVAFALLAIAQSLIPDIQSLSQIAAIFTGLCGIPLLFLDVQNESPGAIDNAAGTGVVLHLAECLRSRPDITDRLRLTFLITSAEEMAATGALFHVLRRESELRLASQSGGLYVLNFDGTGVDGELYLASAFRSGRPGGAIREGAGEEGGISTLLRRAAADLGVPLRRFALTGVLFDHTPFAERGFEAATLMTIGAATWAVHTPQDRPEKLHPRGFELAGRVAMRVIELVGVTDPESASPTSPGCPACGC